MLKHRLIFGTLMAILFVGIVILDGWVDGSLSAALDNKPVQGTGLCILIAVLVVLAQFEFSALAATKGVKVFAPVSVIASVLVATSWYWPQLIRISLEIYLSSLLVFSFFAMFLYQYLRYGTEEVMSNCGGNYFSIIYMGLLSAYVPAIRIDFGLWPMLMFVFVVKSADIGAYAFGTLFGEHKFSPEVSPGKTWEGMGGAVVVAVIVAVLFAVACDIMDWWLAAIFGLCFSFIGQFGDLLESMIKRDAKQKDSSESVPGFGGVLDVIDSPLVAAPFAYLFFMFSCW